MSGSYDVIFGTWMKAKPIKKKEFVTERKCLNKKCADPTWKYADTVIYCPYCGNIVMTLEILKNVEVSISDIVYPEDGETPKCFENLATWEDGNTMTDGGFRKQVNMEATGPQPWAKDGKNFVINSQDEITAFKNRHKKAITTLENAGFELTFEWGPYVIYN